MKGSDFAQVSRISCTMATTEAGVSWGAEDRGSGLIESAVIGGCSLVGDGRWDTPDYSPASCRRVPCWIHGHLLHIVTRPPPRSRPRAVRPQSNWRGANCPQGCSDRV